MAVILCTFVKKHMLWFISSLRNGKLSQIEHNKDNLPDTPNCELPDGSCIEINNSEYQWIDEPDHGIYSPLQ